MATLIVREDGKSTVIPDSSNYRRSTKTGAKSIRPDMRKFPLSEEIKHAAENVYSQMGKPTRKDKNRAGLVFACLHFAHLERNEIHSVKELARIVGIEPNQVSKIIRSFSLGKVPYHSPQRFYSIDEYLHYLVDKINLTPYFLAMVIDSTNTLVRKDPTLIEEQPDLMAAAIIIYFLGITNDDSEVIPKKKDLRNLILNENKLDPMIKKITNLDNQSEI